MPKEPLRNRDPVLWLATGAGLGSVPFGPGTLGALVGLVVACGVYQVPSRAGQVAIMLTLCAIGVPVCGHACRKLNESDPAVVIWDEIVTVPWVYFLIPVEQVFQPATMLTGFVLHRAFDVGKPPPLKLLEHLPGGWGIMADDLGAACYACLVLHLVRYLVG